MKTSTPQLLTTIIRQITLVTLLWLIGLSPASAILYKQVDGGYVNSCGVMTNNLVVCWGSGANGQSSPPTNTFSQVSAGGQHACGLAGGSVKCWGNNDYGQSAPPSGSYSRVSAGGDYTCALSTSGGISCWGSNNYGQTAAPSGTYTALDTGWQHSCAIKSTGAIACWGDNHYKQSTPPAGVYSDIAVGTFYSCAINNSGNIVCWGEGSFGQTSPPAGTFTSLSSGTAHVCALKTDKSIACWGRDNYNQTTPPAGSFTQISAGGTHNCGLKSDGNVSCWGSNVYGESSPPAFFPQAPATPNASDGSYSDRVAVSWSGVTNALYYYVYRSSTSGNGGSPISLKLYTTSFEDGLAVPGTTYYYSVIACFTSGCSGTSPQDAGYASIPLPPIPATPAKPTASDGTVDTGVQISWSGVTGATYYQIRRSESDSLPGTPLPSAVSTTSYLDTSAIQDTQYFYSVSACNSGGCSAYSVSDSGYLAGFSTHIGEAVGNSSLTWSTAGDAAWYVVDGGQSPTSSVRSGSIGDNQTSTLQTRVIGPGELTFYWKVSSEAGNDLLSFQIDQLVSGTPASGEVDWELQSLSIPAGIHDLSWVYSKNGTTVAGTDAGWLDTVTYSGCDTLFDSVTIDADNNPVGGSITLGDGATLNYDSTALTAKDPRCIATLGNTLVQNGANGNLTAPTVVLNEGFHSEPGATFYAGQPFPQVAGDWYFDGALSNGAGSSCATPIDSPSANNITFTQTGTAIEYTAYNTTRNGSLSGNLLQISDITTSPDGDTHYLFSVQFADNGLTLTGTESWKTYFISPPGSFCEVIFSFSGTRQ